jgi:hypothetical protein
VCVRACVLYTYVRCVYRQCISVSVCRGPAGPDIPSPSQGPVLQQEDVPKVWTLVDRFTGDMLWALRNHINLGSSFCSRSPALFSYFCHFPPYTFLFPLKHLYTSTNIYVYTYTYACARAHTNTAIRTPPNREWPWQFTNTSGNVISFLCKNQQKHIPDATVEKKIPKEL